MVAEEVGFEPTELSLNGFQDRRLQPLGHSSNYIRSRAQHAVPLQVTYLVSAHKMYQGLRYYNRTIFLLEILQYRRNCPADSEP